MVGIDVIGENLPCPEGKTSKTGFTPCQGKFYEFWGNTWIWHIKLCVFILTTNTLATNFEISETMMIRRTTTSHKNALRGSNTGIPFLLAYI